MSSLAKCFRMKLGRSDRAVADEQDTHGWHETRLLVRRATGVRLAEVVKEGGAVCVAKTGALVRAEVDVYMLLESRGACGDLYARVVDYIDNGVVLEKLTGDLESCCPVGAEIVRAVGLRTVKALRVLHSLSLVHGDLAPSNLGFRVDPRNSVLLDFGCTHLTWPPCAYPRGCTRALFSPVAQHFCEKIRPIDDMESLIYVLAALLGMNLEWSRYCPTLAAAIEAGSDEGELEENRIELLIGAGKQDFCRHPPPGVPRFLVTYVRLCEEMRDVCVVDYEALEAAFC